MEFSGDIGQQSGPWVMAQCKLDRLVDTEVPKDHIFAVHVILILWIMSPCVLVCGTGVSRAVLPSSSRQL
jgi:hypothetical protein